MLRTMMACSAVMQWMLVRTLILRTYDALQLMHVGGVHSLHTGLLGSDSVCSCNLSSIVHIGMHNNAACSRP